MAQLNERSARVWPGRSVRVRGHRCLLDEQKERAVPTKAIVGEKVGMTQIWEPYRYYEYYKTFVPWVTWLVVARDVLVLALLAVLVWPSRGDADELDAARPAVVGAVDQDALEPHVALGGLEPNR